MFSPKGFLDFAKDVLNCDVLSKNEALSRSVTSRSYYAAFLSAREKIDSLNSLLLFHVQKDMHQQVPEVLQRSYSLQDESLSDDLVELRDYRIDADYHFPGACNPNEQKYRATKSTDLLQTAKDCTSLATNIINRVRFLK